MFIKFLHKIFSNRNDRILKKFKKIVSSINQLEEKFKKLSDKKLQENTGIFRLRLKKGECLDDLLPESFATVREASRRVFNMRHFDVQILGGIVLNKQCIAEMRTGEGKTLTSTLPAYLNALTGRGVHIVTMNDYLAERDAKNNTPLFEFLGLTVGLNLPEMSFIDKKKAYLCDITYGTNNEYGFDYLRDNMIFSAEERVQRELNYALIDEVDSILIDEARTPLIISGPSEDSSFLYKEINKLVPSLICQKKEDSDKFHGNGHFSIDEKSKQIYLTERGLVEVEKILLDRKLMKKEESLYSSNNIILMHHVISALRAHNLFTRNIDYLVKDNNIIIVDEHTGRTMPGRRWSDGLHQAIEAKENVTVRNENQTLASITFQNYFRLYKKIAGMTGTAATESFEFSSIYNLDTVIIPPNKPMIRKDLSDLVYMTEEEKINAILKDIKNCIKKNQPVLVGTISIEKSEMISKKLKILNIKHNVLNAKFHAREAEIIAQAGKPKSVTIATNMAGRGTDIVLGGSLESQLEKNMYLDKIETIKRNWKKQHDLVVLSGGLHIIGTERHESRRIDNQLRGRSGRQGDSGSSRFYLSMEDSLMRIFASDKIISMMRKLGLSLNEAIEHPWVTKAIENAQKKVENRNFDIRKQLLEYDDVCNEQRRVIYAQRNKLIDSENIQQNIYDILKDVLHSIIKTHLNFDFPKNTRNILDLENKLSIEFNLNISIKDWLKKDHDIKKENIIKKIIDIAKKNYLNKEIQIGFHNIRMIEKSIMLKTLDSLWKEHLSAMDYLRQGIHLRGYAQKDPKQEYKRESFNMFSNMLELLKYEVISFLSKLDISYIKSNLHLNMNNNSSIVNNDIKMGRNTPCFCKSGKKYKYCHGSL
ncbi:preprotein translocase subunit SecA [Buchnera aphidicola]|uniref:Protein translocase subunit SecA n=1 Tax=Buchnera aphidicola subsp. Schizaphis graminum (strain Sg) TaxID=198804 RepID=SECA_BUCAP|nr:preprotein translocase subunit SecA [Buchnera aphidicola]Q8K9U3.1 RecName: Full=Protein translocase subunit SecA [Buchnera aphidicola str. Sg (Schizaphis graminum)]AAM67759.1 preprotein translocase SecA subunit [Buchnera aphidicola str. Sg (Schizaphis graminum)]AWI49743.1 preprotein translocase subunit SecA [Buchnera aphidicola (Schizaphis graminum)]